jgi:hypothetical protein
LTNQVSTPTFSPVGGTFPPVQLSVTIASATVGAPIRYTLDGSIPGSYSGTLYSVPVIISNTSTLRAIAYQGGFTDSDVASASYFIDDSLPVPSPEISGISLAGTDLLVTATNGIPGTTCQMLTSSNLALPVEDWTMVAAQVVGPDGGFSFTNFADLDIPGQFYRLRLGP